MALQHMGHPHPLVFHQDKSNQSEGTFHCSGCEGEVSGPCFSCADCGFYLHKKCAEAPMEIDHPFHRRHPLILLPPSPNDEGRRCDLCRKKGKGFLYRCSSCEINLDLNCALLPRDTAGNFIQTLHVAHQHPLILIENGNNHLQSFHCYGCSNTLIDASYACFDCKIFFDKKCVELPIEINHPYHRKHPLILDFEKNPRDCNLCESKHYGYFYRCSLCNVDIHNKCDLPPPIIEDKNDHEHPFILLFRPNISFTCDACGTQGSNVSYTCSTCHLQVHKKCISLPCIIGIVLHHHPIYRNFFLRLHPQDSKSWDCRICYEKVNLEHGSYYCSKPDCNFIIHVNCAVENSELYGMNELKNQDEIEEFNREITLCYDKSMDCITRVIKEIKIGEDVIAAEIEHISHGHNLTFSNEIVDNKHCDGCVLPILSSFYYCSRCDFFLHKTCAELSKKQLPQLFAVPFTFHTNRIFRCGLCEYFCSGFSYIYDVDDGYHLCFCLRCFALPHSFRYPADETHRLFYDPKYEGQCSACGRKKDFIFRSQDYNFALDTRCPSLPQVVWHKCDKHSLRLVYGDDNDYPLHHYCEICEEKRDSKYWFYCCEVCDTTVHLKCVLGKYPFIKPGSNFTDKNRHPHPLTFIQKIHDYPECVECGKPCEDISIECSEHGCNYIVHCGCVSDFDLGSDGYSE